MKKEMSHIEQSISNWNKHSLEEYKDWLFKQIKTNNGSTIFLKNHIQNFMSKYKNHIGIEENFLYKKLFFINLELKNYKESYNILIKLIKDFGRERKLLRMYGEESEIDPKGGDIPMRQYKSMMINDQNDNESIKKYIYFMKLSMDLNDKQTINDYVELWNLYLDAYMNDPEAYNELSQVYLMVNEYDKAIFCLEELLLHTPNDYKVLNKIGDIYCSKNNLADAKTAIKFYSRSILINPTPRAFFGIQNCCSIIVKKEKKLDESTQKLLDISKNELKKLYENTNFKDFDVNKIFKV
jgi:tetratricopeptide (TPR) repeat protein